MQLVIKQLVLKCHNYNKFHTLQHITNETVFLPALILIAYVLYTSHLFIFNFNLLPIFLFGDYEKEKVIKTTGNDIFRYTLNQKLFSIFYIKIPY